ncbi:MAG: 2-iminoacetate synthase ThiH [Candidatus Omnitrophica bacterium]|nr:2-iminoacetate synthase ThiH [Candidatus Omnitrophota bacterium]
MSFYSIYKKYKNIDLNKLFESRPKDIKKVLMQDNMSFDDFSFLLSVEAEEYLEDMAQKAHRITLQNFGKTIQLYTPIYLSSYCDNKCVYCGFKKDNLIKRRKLSLEEVEKEASFIAATGLAHILVLVGDSREHSPVSYIKECVKVLGKYFASISIEIYALTENEYRQLIDAGVDGLTIYQEVYDEQIYDELHFSGPKKDYIFRLDAPERGAKAGMRTINIGVLLGLNDFRTEAFFLGLHAKYLQDKYTDTEISISVPRIRSYAGSFEAKHSLSDKNLVQMIMAIRLFLPRVGVTVSTRENERLRENLLPFGVTKISAGTTTAVGGHTLDDKEKSSLQFDLLDKRSVADITEMLRRKGYQPVFKDWMKV